MAFRYRRPASEYGKCLRCECVLTDSNWSKSQQSYRRFMCMPCYSARQREYAAKKTPQEKAAYRERLNEARRNWSPEKKEENRKRCYGYWLRSQYGATIEWFDSQYASQGGKCAICETDKPRGKGGFHVDHCHKTGKLRALLCAECNMMLGLAKDNPLRLLKAIAYLEAHAKQQD